MPDSTKERGRLAGDLVRVLMGIGVGLLAAPLLFATILELYPSGSRRRRIVGLAGSMVGWFAFYGVLVTPTTHQWLQSFRFFLPGLEVLAFALVAFACVAGGLLGVDRVWLWIRRTKDPPISRL